MATSNLPNPSARVRTGGCKTFKMLTSLLIIFAVIINLTMQWRIGILSLQPEADLDDAHNADDAALSTDTIPIPGLNESSLSFCESNNFMPLLNDTEISRHANNTKLFSIRKQDFLPTHPKSCGTSDELLQAIAMGQRRWDDHVENANLTLGQKEEYPSQFIPHQCSIPYYPPDQVCNVLNRFSHVIVHGDSLSNHLQSGMLMSLSGNFVNGSSVSPNAEQRNCTCDAQFSQHKKCRHHDGLHHRFQPHQLGLCPNLDVGSTSTSTSRRSKNNNDIQQQPFESIMKMNRLRGQIYNFDGVNCTSPESRGILILAQAGPHLLYNADRTYNTLIRKFFDQPTFRSCAEQGKAMLIWTSYQAQSPAYDAMYLTQTKEHGLKFNKRMNEIFEKHNITAPVMDWLNFTTGAPHSDGLHYSAHVNYFKAQHMIALVDRLSNEKKFFDLPKTY